MRPPVRTRLAAAFWAVRVECSIRRRRVDDLAAISGVRLDLTPAPPPVPTGDQPGDAADAPALSSPDVDVLRLVARLYARWPDSGTCLRQCLVVGRLLRYRDPVLRIGVRPGPDRLLMHAWLEFGGIPVDPTADQFATLSAR